ADVSAQKAERDGRGARQQGVFGRRDRVEANAIRKGNVISRARVEGPLDVERRVATEQDPLGIQQKQIRSRDRGTYRAIAIRAGSPGHPTQNVLDPTGTIEARDVAGANAEVFETVKLIGSADRPAVDVVHVARRRDGGTERAVRPDLRNDLAVA